MNLCTGDRLFWPRLGALNYRGRFEDWEEYLNDLVRREGVTDILYYADRLPYHAVAADVARAFKINAITYEFGYLRPDWITLERGGMSAYSHFPQDPDVIRALARDLPEPDMAVHYAFAHQIEAAYEVFYNLSSYFGRLLYPFYKSDRIYNPLVEYVSHIPRLLSGGFHQRQSNAAIDALVGSETPFYLFPLQIQSDYQLRENSPFAHQNQAIELTIKSFAENAPEGAHLVIKQHPLDSGYEGWKGTIKAIAQRHGVARRVVFIKAGDLGKLLGNALGTVLINSTVGVHALRHGCPVKVLGIATYDIEGLTCQRPLDQFWQSPPKPDADLCNDLVRLWGNSIQVKGNFYTRAGRKAGVQNLAERLCAGTVNEPGAFVPVPPRLARARMLGIGVAAPGEAWSPSSGVAAAGGPAE
ncbi:capsular biosynthesis protein [Breoghania sp. L-A4]|uniref:capsule biosynthesis protein n=1 Tax=Breoghania sp. L-A4 TaxID=2304600 RepID=UPI0020BF3700|nr:capsular biosynthesis protein [Breoghania sp. L-A4]